MSDEGQLSPEQTEARARIDELTARPAYLDASDPEHGALVEQVTKLFAVLHPEGDEAPLPEGVSPDLVEAMTAAMTPPETREGYQIDPPRVPPGVDPEQVEYSRELETAARGWFHRAGLNQGQVSQVLEKFHASTLDPAPVDHGADAARKAEAEAALRLEFGDAYEEKIAAAQAAVQRLGGQDLIDILDGTQLGNDPFIIKLFVEFAKKGATP